jgi:hypothetical protein
MYRPAASQVTTLSKRVVAYLFRFNSSVGKVYLQVKPEKMLLLLMSSLKESQTLNPEKNAST